MTRPTPYVHLERNWVNRSLVLGVGVGEYVIEGDRIIAVTFAFLFVWVYIGFLLDTWSERVARLPRRR